MRLLFYCLGLVVIFGGKLYGETLVVCSSQLASEQEWDNLLRNSTGKTYNFEKPFTLTVYHLGDKQIKSWEVHTGPGLVVALDTSKKNLIAVTANDQSYVTTVQIFNLANGTLVKKYSIEDFIPSVKWNGNGPLATHNLQKIDTGDTFYILGYQKEQPTGDVQFGGITGDLIKDPLPRVPTLIMLNPDKELKRLQLDSAPGNFAELATSIQLSRYVMMSNYNIAGGPHGGMFKQYSIIDLKENRTVLLDTLAQYLQLDTNDALTLINSQLIAIDGYKGTYGLAPDIFNLGKFTRLAIKNMPGRAAIDYVHGDNADPNLVSVVLNSLTEGAAPSGTSQLAILDTLSSQFTTIGPVYSKPTDYAVVWQQKGGIRKYYVINNKNIQILDANLNKLQDVETNLDFPYDLLVCP